MRRFIKTDNTKLDIGCGQNKIDGFIGMDKRDFGQEILWDINHGIPFPNDSISEIHSSHFVEHLKEHEINNFINELMRVCVNGAKIQISCPHSSVKEAYYICHYTRWDEQRIEGICSEFRKTLEIVDMEVKGINFITNLKINK